MRLRKPETIPLLFIITATLLLTSLGIWQVQRLQWKNEQAAQVKLAQEKPALGYLPQEIDMLQNPGDLDYRNVVLTGRFVYNRTLHRIGHIQDEGMGFFLLTPLVLEDDGRIVLVNRGFSPKDKESRPKGVQTVRGIIRPLREKRLFSPENKPQNNLWFYEDIPAMGKATQLPLLPVMVEATGKREFEVYPVPHDGTIVLRNDHLNYAITWFSLAIIGLVMFIIYHRIPNPKND